MPHRLSIALSSRRIAAVIATAIAAVFADVFAGEARADTDRQEVPDARAEALRRINAARRDDPVCASTRPDHATPPLAPLRWNERLARAAESQAGAMATQQRLGHRDGAGRGLVERLTLHGYPLGVAVENVAFGPPTLAAVLDAWRASAAHCANLMHPQVVELGLAVVERDGTRYWALLLGARAPGSVDPSAFVAAPISRHRPGAVD